MSLESGGLRAASPASSGRASPISRRQEDGALPKDKAYRRYTSAIERALGSFDTAQQEWADYISFLSRLLKALQAHPPECHVVPDNQTVATRLAQCLNPTLPSGVHQKALEVYAYVFTIIGKSNLARDLHLYFPGLSSVLSFASLSVRPYFLALLEKHILLIDTFALRPALKAIILCLLPGLEDESSEDFEDIVRVVDKFREASRELHTDGQQQDAEDARDSYFWQCFFLATVTSPSRRQGALAFLVRHLPKFGTTVKKGTEKENGGENGLRTLPIAAQAALSPEPGLLIRCFAAGLSDKQLLVQRGFLDLLVTHLPLDSAVLQYAVPQADLDRLIFAAAGVVSRRDMSLNRRLWAWFLGPEPKTEPEDAPNSPTDVKSPAFDLSSHHATYFARYGLRSLTRSILALFARTISSPAERARPFRICLSLMDRWEVGGLLIPDLFIPAMMNAFEYSQTGSKVEVDEVIKSASIFFDGVESGLIWAKFFELAMGALTLETSEIDRNRNLDICLFMIQRFNLREEEMVLYHMPLLAFTILAMLNSQPVSDTGDKPRDLASDVAEKLVSMIPDRAFVESKDSSKRSKGNKTLSTLAMVKIISRFYEDDQGTIEGSSNVLPTPLIGSRLLREALTLFINSINASASSTSMDASTKVLCALLPKILDVLPSLHELDLAASLRGAIAPQNTRTHGPTFSAISAATATLAVVQQVTGKTPYLAEPEIVFFQNALVELLWNYLSPHHPKYHVEAVRCIWHLEAISVTSRCVEASLTRLLSSSLTASGLDVKVPPAEAGRRFAVLWTHSMQEKGTHGDKLQRAVVKRTSSIVGLVGSTGIPSDPSSVLARPLLILLDSLTDEGTELSTFVINWLQHLSALPRVFDIIISSITALKCFRVASGNMKKSPRTAARSTQASDSKECLYYMRHIFYILKDASEHTWLTVGGEMIEPHYQQGDEEMERLPLQFLLVRICMTVLEIAALPQEQSIAHASHIQSTALEILLVLIQGPFSAPLKELNLELPLLGRLQRDLDTMDPVIQSSILATVTAALKLQFRSIPPLPKSPHQRKFSREMNPSSPSLSQSKERGSTDTVQAARVAPPPSLVECLKAGFSSPSSRIVLDSWVKFLSDVLPLFADTIYQNLIPLVECFCAQIGVVFDELRSTFRQPASKDTSSPEPTLISLMNGLEQILARGHDRLVDDEHKTASNKSPDQPQGFFGNMVQGVFNNESQQPTRTATANSRLAVLLCFQDTVRTCFSVWSWGVYGLGNEKQDTSSFASFGYTSLRMRNRARRLLENLFAAEALECLETLVVLFYHPPSPDFQPESVMGLLNVLNGSRPKHTIPAIFNAIYSRTNPTALDPGRMSSLTSELSDTEIVGFLVEYLKSIEDDAIDEIWPDCMAFLKDVLTNPLPHSQILPILLDFVALIAEKVDNTNFGEQRKMRKELGDLFLRLLTAALTTRPMGFLQEPKQLPAILNTRPRATSNGHANSASSPRDFVSILAFAVPRLQLILTDNERISAAASSISTNVTGPTIRAKLFPSNVDVTFLELLLSLTKISQGTKSWRKDVTDALNDARFFATPSELVKNHWSPIFYQLVLNDKDRMPDLLGRLTAPTTAGIVFGVGATSARMEADKKTQLNLRRIALLILSSAEDTFVPNLGTIEEKIVELFTSTPTSSPSSATWSEVYLLLRALVLRTSSVHLAPLWPTINAELQKAILSLLPESVDAEKYTSATVLQACKLLDTLIAIEPDDFQLHEWLFITDTIDAVYRPPTSMSTALADEIAEALGTTASHHEHVASISTDGSSRKPFLDPMILGLENEGQDVKAMKKDDLARRVLRPFFGQLSILAFENTYEMVEVNRAACEEGLVRDLFTVEGDTSGGI